MSSRLLPLIGLMLAEAPAAAVPPDPTPATLSVPFTIDQIFGSRPVVDATISGRPYRLVVHANAGSYLQINHAEAKAVGAHDLTHRGAYGIAAPGQVSDLGRDDGMVDRLAIGNWRSATAPVAVFEVPAGGSQGMLGLPFLHDNNVVVDFAARTMTIAGARPLATLATALAARGYSAHPMSRDPADGRYLITVTINGVDAPMVVSTVATVDVDTGFAQRARVATGAVAGSYGGPTGATGQVYDPVAPLTIRIGTWTSKPIRAQIEDTYAYSTTPRPTGSGLARGGALGADFMIANEAVIDFGNAILYLKG